MRPDPRTNTLPVAGHIEETLAVPDMPGIAIRFAVPPEHWYSPVDGDGNLGVASASEDRASAAVRIDEEDLAGSQGEFAFSKLSYVAGGESKAGGLDRPTSSGN